MGSCSSVKQRPIQAQFRVEKQAKSEEMGPLVTPLALIHPCIHVNTYMLDYLNEESSSRKGNTLKHAAKYLGKPGLISLGGGLPSSEYFPFAELSLKVPKVGQFSEEETEQSGAIISSGKHDLLENISIFDISTAFNYGQGTGAAQLL